MISRALAPYILAAVVGMIALAGWQGYRFGVKVTSAAYEAARVATQKKADALAVELRAAELELAAARKQTEELQDELDITAREDPDNQRPGVSDAGWMRTNRVWDQAASP